jgi:hypothetical protein
MAGSIPPPNTAMVDGNGYVQTEWYRWFSRKEAAIGPGEVSTTGGLAGGGSISAGIEISIAPKGVTDAKFRDSAACSVIGRFQDSAGTPTDIRATDNNRVLIRLDDQLVFKHLSARLAGIDDTLGDYANDAAAAGGGVEIGDVYRNGSVLMVRVT